MSIAAVVAHNLVRLRTKHGLTQEGLAEESGVARSTVAAIEGCRYQSTSTKSLEELAEAMGEPVTEFFLQPAAKPRKRKAG